MKCKYLLIGMLLTIGVFVQSFGQVKDNPKGCSELIISEVVYGYKPENNGKPKKDYALEIYNPTDQPIKLDDYSVTLNNDNQVVETINLSGQLASEEAYVIVHPDAEQNIKNKSDISDSRLDFKNKTHIELFNQSTKIDKVGEPGVYNPSTINVSALLNNPNVLHNAPINLQSAKGVTMQRRHAAMNGKPFGFVQNVYKDWLLYPSTYIQGLGDHVTACKVNSVTVQYVENNGSGTAGVEKNEDDFGTALVSGTVETIGSFSDDIIMHAPPTGVTTLVNVDPATEYSDYDVAVWNNEFTIFGGAASTDADLATVYADTDVESDEDAEFGLAIWDDGGQTVFIGFPDVFHIVILDDDANGLAENNSENNVNILPNVFNEKTELNVTNKSNAITNVKVVNIHGAIVTEMDVNSMTTMQLNTSDLAEGYYSFLIQTRDGLIVKKGIKIKS